MPLSEHSGGQSPCRARFLRTREDGPSVGKNTANPKFGVTSFKQLSKIWSEIVASEDIPQDIWEDMWKIRQNFPGKLAKTILAHLAPNC
jgi:hypothetical protein